MKTEGIDLIRKVEEKISSVRTRSLDLSFNELLDMYLNDELIINPDYQRLFRWSDGKQSRFIETLLLELPIPPIFVIEDSEGVYELIDGLQRISSYLNFRGKLKKEEKLTLIDCDIVDELNGLTYEELPKPLEIKLKRNFIRVEILRKESDPRLRYYMFKRLNTGGEDLTEQEIRNSSIRLLDNGFNNILITFSVNGDFQSTISNIAPEKKNEKYDQELALRFLALKNQGEQYIKNVGDFLTNYMEFETEQVIEGVYKEDEEKLTFEKTFKILNKVMGGQVFAGLSQGGRPQNSFAVYHFEAFSIGIQESLGSINENNDSEISALKKLFLEIKGNSDFKQLTTGGGKNTKRQFQARVNFVKEKVRILYESE